MNAKYILTSTLIGTSVLFSSVAPAVAQSPKLNSKQEERAGKRCELVNGRIDARIAKFNGKKDNVVSKQRKIKERLTKLADRLEQKGYDVSKVRSDLEILDEMVKTADLDYVAFIKELDETKQFDCGNAQGSFREALEQSKTALAKFRDDVKAVREFIKNTLRPDLKALKGQNPGSTTTE
ncbi:MAG: hypothetical protein UV54_C0048G0003 [Candidatus Beckwithbacteria bacterium GW2011_GWA2_43_10]|uniref:DUF5667 domain-containing protein n=1 Tax=Candidatus Beckwithbacteria bacterium GW2011_GWA2_43_10 TaxID=1618369 RepID=A0A0G1E757_9BACT|nr:MAG: hypothetical protein UV54_C0048G0003 [Candidatus Beckwithbacteria bacterium GW2011_GWA2_43_10]